MKIKNYIPVLLVLIFSILAILPLFSNGFFPMHDDTQVARVYAIAKSLRDGLFPVRWVADLGYGYGYPIFNFYGPLPYYIGGFFDLIGFSALVSAKIMFVIGILLSGISMYIFSSRFFGKLPGVVSAVAYLYFPYHAVNIYVRGAVGEFFAYAFLPLIFLGLFKLFELSNSKKSNEKVAFVLLTSISLSLALISHTLSGIMILIILSLFFVVTIFFTKKKVNYSILFLVSLFLGIILSSFFTVPAALEMKYTNVNSQIGGGANFPDHFVCVQQFLNSNWGFGGSVPGCIDGLSFIIGKINILLVLFSFFALIFLIKTKKIEPEKTNLVNAAFILFTISLFLQTELSNIVWNAIPFMEYIQYPWRFMNFTALFASFLIAFLIFSVSKIYEKGALFVSIIVLLGVLFFNSKFFNPQKNLTVNSEYYTNSQNLHFKTSKVSDEYLPEGFKKPLSEKDIVGQKVAISNGFVNILEDKTGILRIEYNSEKESNNIIFYRTYFPGWRAFVNGEEIKINKYDNSFMNLVVGKGSGNIILKVTQTPIQITGNALTLFAIVLIFAVIIFEPLKNIFQKIVDYE